VACIRFVKIENPWRAEEKEQEGKRGTARERILSSHGTAWCRNPKIAVVIRKPSSGLRDAFTLSYYACLPRRCHFACLSLAQPLYIFTTKSSFRRYIIPITIASVPNSPAPTTELSVGFNRSRIIGYCCILTSRLRRPVLILFILNSQKLMFY
jgi:hypothetical protein